MSKSLPGTNWMTASLRIPGRRACSDFVRQLPIEAQRPCMRISQVDCKNWAAPTKRWKRTCSAIFVNMPAHRKSQKIQFGTGWRSVSIMDFPRAWSIGLIRLMLPCISQPGVRKLSTRMERSGVSILQRPTTFCRRTWSNCWKRKARTSLRPKSWIRQLEAWRRSISSRPSLFWHSLSRLL